MSEVMRKDGLGIIFAFFLGLMVTAFVGVGVYTFYAPPDQYSQRLAELADEANAIREARFPYTLTDEQTGQLDAIAQERAEVQKAYNRARQDWMRTSSMILVLLATLTMVISLTAAQQYAVISNGLLLGGVFTMLYGVGWTVFSGNTVTRFMVISIALAITIALGYLRFVRKRAQVVIHTDKPLDNATLAAIEQRVLALEQRINAAAAVLGKDNE